jgi:polyribonucleotide nucleotidyltransferase
MWGGRKLVLETGKMARQADGAVVATYGETTVLATVVSMKEPKPGFDFFPLTVNYQERTYAAGRIPAATSSARAVRPRRRRSSPASSTVRSAPSSSRATRTTPRWS